MPTFRRFKADRNRRAETGGSGTLAACLSKRPATVHTSAPPRGSNGCRSAGTGNGRPETGRAALDSRGPRTRAPRPARSRSASGHSGAIANPPTAFLRKPCLEDPMPNRVHASNSMRDCLGASSGTWLPPWFALRITVALPTDLSAPAVNRGPRSDHPSLPDEVEPRSRILRAVPAVPSETPRESTASNGFA